MSITGQKGHHQRPETLHLGCGDDYRAGAINVDVREDSAADLVFDITDDWDPIADASMWRVEAHHVLEHIAEPAHVFAEAARVLRDGGQLIITVPLGVNAATDLDHAHAWTFRTPEQFSQTHRRPWDPDVPFDLVGRHADVWFGGPLSKASPLLRLAALRWPAWAARRCYAGELWTRYQRQGREGGR